MKRVDFKTSKGILQEIEDSINDFKEDKKRLPEVEMRLRGCNHAVKIHMLQFMQEKMDYDLRNINVTQKLL